MANRTVLLKNKESLIEKIVQSGFSYRQLAKETGISQTTISLIINGERNPSPENAVKICNALNCQFNDIFFVNNDYKSNQTKISKGGKYGCNRLFKTRNEKIKQNE